MERGKDGEGVKISIDLDDLTIDGQSVAEEIRQALQREIQLIVRQVVRDERKELKKLVEKATEATIKLFKDKRLSVVAQQLIQREIE